MGSPKRGSERALGVLALIFTTIVWSAPPLFQKYLLASFDNSTQNFYRYAIGFFVSVPFFFMKLRSERLRLRASDFALMLLPAVPNIFNQYAGVAALNDLMPGFASLFVKLGIFFTLGISYMLLRDERWLFSSSLFLVGLAFALLGSVGLAVLKPLGYETGRFYRGIFWILITGPAWAFYSIMIKKTTGRLGAGVSFSLISFWTALGFLILSGFSGGLGSVRSASWQANTVMVVSAVFAIGLAHPLYYYSLRVLGVTVCQVILLTTPIFTILASGVFFGEKLTLVQAVFGALLLGGGAVAVLAREPQADLPAVKDS